MEALLKTLAVIEQTKNYFMDNLDNYLMDNLDKTNENEEKFIIIDKIKQLDEKILYYNNLINNAIKENNKILIEENDNENQNENKINNIIKHNSRKKKNIKIYNNKINNSNIKIEKELTYYDDELDLEITFGLQSTSKNYAFYKCKKRPLCKGRLKIDLLNKNITIIEKCSKEIEHDNLNYDNFYIFYNNNNQKNKINSKKKY